MGLGGNTQISKGEGSSVLQTWLGKPRVIQESWRDRLGGEREIEQELERRGPPKSTGWGPWEPGKGQIPPLPSVLPLQH